ncbi:MAG: response regulator, partial [Ruminiclostridium sp.]
MYKIVVVDDEKTIRKGMCNYIAWNEMGFEVVADFEDGKETIQYISKHTVDVVLTDIEMAQVTGLELAKYIYENKLPIKIVIISGYKEFEYARKAVEYNVEYYL